jgi:uncharacterized protein
MRITLDTNILVSASFWQGDSSRIIEKAEKKELEIVLSREIIDELIKVLDYKEIQQKIKDKNLELKNSVEKITSLSVFVHPQLKYNIIKEDLDDNKILECAKEGKADYIITNDKHLLRIKEFEGINIITPAEFLKKTH